MLEHIEEVVFDDLEQSLITLIDSAIIDYRFWRLNHFLHILQSFRSISTRLSSLVLRVQIGVDLLLINVIDAHRSAIFSLDL